MKYPYTDQNHFKFGYSPANWFSQRESADQVFSFQYGQIQSEVQNWRQANIEACRRIGENFSEPLFLLYSGGTDSECMALSFLEAKVPFQLVSLRFAHGKNAHDLNWARQFAQDHDLKIDFVELDVEEFLQSSKLLEYTDPIQCVSPILACHLWLADQVPGVPVIGQGECYLKKKVPPDYVPGISPYEPSTWSLIESERLCSLYMHFIQMDKPAVPGFFQYRPEQIHSYLKFNPILRRLVENQVTGKLGTRSSKNEMVRYFYPEIKVRPKFTGFEEIQELHDQLRNQLAERYPLSDQDAALTYDEVLEMLMPTI